MLTERVQRWRNEGAIEEVDGRKLFVRRRGGGGDEPLLLFLHGFPSSSYDWRPLFELRPAGEATLTFDFLGFGLSEKPRDHEYTLAWQADAVEELVRRAGSPPVFVVGHDMGTSVATELMARDLRGELGMRMTGAMLFNGSMLLHLAKPTLGQNLLRSRLGSLFARLTSERSFRAQFSRVF
ncbi:MAG TPA: alpha/beta fold hydrolase, partial [Solirubrobacterales bacterium]|nr:alpha/beta fold hydrolase [Solirubrobacterales bacterium]